MHISAIDLNLLTVLHAVLRTGSVKGAAEELALSPSATSHALGRLREVLEDPILVRAGKQMALTPRAERLRPEVARVVDGIERVLLREPELDPKTVRRAFRIASTDFAELMVLGPASRRLEEEAPGIDLFASRLGPNATEQLRGDVDMAIGVFREGAPDISTEPLSREEFVSLLRPDHPVLARRFTLARFLELKHVLVSPRGTAHGVVDQLLDEQGLWRRVARTVSSFLVAPHIVAETDYVVTLPRRIAEFVDLGLAVKKPPLDVPGFTLSLAWHRRHDDDPAHALVRRALHRKSRSRKAG